MPPRRRLPPTSTSKRSQAAQKTWTKMREAVERKRPTREQLLNTKLFQEVEKALLVGEGGDTEEEAEDEDEGEDGDNNRSIRRHTVKPGEAFYFRTPEQKDGEWADGRTQEIGIVEGIYKAKAKGGLVWVWLRKAIKAKQTPPSDTVAGDLKSPWGIAEVILTDQFSVEWLQDITSNVHLYILDQADPFPATLIHSNDWYVRYYQYEDKLYPIGGTIDDPDGNGEQYGGTFCCLKPYGPNTEDLQEIYCLRCEGWWHVDCCVEIAGEGEPRWLNGDEHLIDNLTNAPIIRGRWYTGDWRDEWMLQGSGPSVAAFRQNAPSIPAGASREEILAVFHNDELAEALEEIKQPWLTCPNCEENI